MNGHGNSSLEDLIFHGTQDPDHPAIESPGYPPLTYRDLKKQVLYGIKSLNAMGFCRNDRIAVIMPAGPATAVVSLTVMAGFTSAPLNPEFKEQEFETFLSKLKIKAIIVEKDCETAARTVAASRALPVIEVTPSMDAAGRFTFGPISPSDAHEAVFSSPSDIALLMQTSGTTSVPKIVPLSQKQLCASVQVYGSLFSQGDKDRSLHIVPYYHLLGIVGTFLTPLAQGGTVICTKNFVASDFPSLLKTHHPTYYIAGPAHHQAILSELRRIPPDELKNNSLRLIRSTSAALPLTVLRELEALLGVSLVESYAMTESPCITVNVPYKEGSVGIPTNISLIITDENSNSLKPHEHGEIAIRGEGVFSGYEDAPDENASAFINGWFRTGDMGYLDDDGYLYITGRRKELINKGGEKISPAEIDAVLMGHPLVDQAMAFRIMDPALGEDIAAMVVPAKGNVSENDLRDYLLDHLVQFKVPKKIFFVDAVPRGPTGKLLRYAGTERYNQEQCTDREKTGQPLNHGSYDISSNQEILSRIWKDILDIEPLSPDDDFFMCGGNSLTAIELLIKIQRIFHINFPADTIYRYPTLRDQTSLISVRLGDAAHEHTLIIPIRREGYLPPLFCVHPIGGWVSDYITLSRVLNPKRPVFGIRARGLEPAEIPQPTVTGAVQEYLDAIKTVQKNGPYHILGFSVGGIYAFELACQLIKKGEPVAYLGIIDASAPRPEIKALRSLVSVISPDKGSFKIPAGVSRFYGQMEDHLKTNPDSLPYSLCVKVIHACSRIILYLSGSGSGIRSLPDVGREPGVEEIFLDSLHVPGELYPLVRSIRNAASNYLPRRYPGDIILFSTGPDQIFFPGDPTRGWSSYTRGRTEVIDIPGDHETLFNEPFCRGVAEKIEYSLDLVDGHAK
jgi:acyl-CoA synthetase (AMP-forming)/AMP-acid ligase II/thioesterase domain-containing protein/acyl carrier protein